MASRKAQLAALNQPQRKPYASRAVAFDAVGAKGHAAAVLQCSVPGKGVFDAGYTATPRESRKAQLVPLAQPKNLCRWREGAAQMSLEVTVIREGGRGKDNKIA